MPPQSQYRIIRIPSSLPNPSSLVAKFRTTKLKALLADPNSFSSTYEKEALLTLETWTQRLAPPSTIFVCVAESDGAECALVAGDDERLLLECEWVGMVTLRGPQPYSTYHLPSYKQPTPEEISIETRFHLSNLWTSSSHRGLGLAKKLVNACFDFAANTSRSQSKRNARVRLIIKDEGSFLKGMYEGMGFGVTGRASLKEACFASGDGKGVPKDTGSTQALRELWEARYGVVMERIINVDSA